MKWTRQRCQVACNTLATAALMPSWASEITSLTPRRPRRASLRRKPVQKVSASDRPISMPPCPTGDACIAERGHLAPAVGVDADRDGDGDADDAAGLANLEVRGVDPQ